MYSDKVVQIFDPKIGFKEISLIDRIELISPISTVTCHDHFTGNYIVWNLNSRKINVYKTVIYWKFV